jgi:excisionase family DNA binding protein
MSTKNKIKPGYLRTRHIADLYGAHPETIRRALRTKRIKGIKMGRNWLVPNEELARIGKEGI